MKRHGLRAAIGTWVLPIYLLIALAGLTWSYDWCKAGCEQILTGKAIAEASDAGVKPAKAPVRVRPPSGRRAERARPRRTANGERRMANGGSTGARAR